MARSRLWVPQHVGISKTLQVSLDLDWPRSAAGHRPAVRLFSGADLNFELTGYRCLIAAMRTAFKEWAIIGDALGHGDQIVILRKGGISEDSGGFQVDHPEFLLFPTVFHQQRESVLPSAQARYDVIAPVFPPPTILRLEYFAEVVAWRRIESLAAAERLRGQHIWRDEVIAERFAWGREHAIYALAVRVFGLGEPCEIPMLPAYGGCKSWIEIDREIMRDGSIPVLSNADFGVKLEKFEQALGR